MSESLQLLARWRGFRKGDYGMLAPQLAEPESFAGKNLVVNAAGAVQARGGLQPLGPHLNSSTPIWHVGFLRGTGATGLDWIYFIQEQSGTHSVVRRFAYRFPGMGIVVDQDLDPDTVGAFIYDGDQIDSLGTEFYATTPNGEDVTYLAVSGDGVYRLNHLANPPTVTKLSVDTGANAIAISGDRLVIGGNVNGETNRVRYSAPGDYDSWPSTNFFPVGRKNESIRALYQIGQTLYVLMKEGTLYAVTGTVGVNESLRQVNAYGEHTAGVAYQRAAIPTRNNVLWHTRASDLMQYQDGSATIDSVFQVPVAISSGRRVEHPELDQWLHGSLTDQMASPVYAMRLDGLDDVAFAYGSQLWLFSNGAWTRHDFPLSQSQSRWCHAYFGHVVVYDPAAEPSKFFTINLSPDGLAAPAGSAYYPYDKLGLADEDTVVPIDAQLRPIEFEHPKGLAFRVRYVDFELSVGSNAPAGPAFDLELLLADLLPDDEQDDVVVAGHAHYERDTIVGGDRRQVWRAPFEQRQCRRAGLSITNVTSGVRIEQIRMWGYVEVDVNR